MIEPRRQTIICYRAERFYPTPSSGVGLLDSTIERCGAEGDLTTAMLDGPPDIDNSRQHLVLEQHLIGKLLAGRRRPNPRFRRYSSAHLMRATVLEPRLLDFGRPATYRQAC